MWELLGLAVAAAVLLFPILSIIALVRTREIRALRLRLNEFDSKLQALERALRAVRSEGLPARASAPAPSEFVQGPPRVVAPAAPAAQPQAVPTLAAAEPARAPGPGSGAPPAPAPTKPAPPPALKIDWERWIGIRGAAVLGGAVLALAALLFFQYSIQRGLITPPMRVALGLAVGVACLVGSEWIRPRGYRVSAEGIAGGGVACLYAAFWAAHSLYGLIGATPTFVLMGLVTVTCCLLSIRHGSQTVAVLGLAGGFATPLLLRSEADHPVGLFGYVLLLDVGLLAIGRRKSWPLLGALSLLGTVLLQGLWFQHRMSADRLFLGLLILAVFAVLFALAPQTKRSGARSGWLGSQAGAILFSISFAVYFAARADLGPHLWPLGILLVLLAAAASWVARANRAPWLGLGAALGSLAVVAVWLSQRTLTAGSAWELALTSAALALVFHVFVELRRDLSNADGPAPAAIVAAGGFFLVTSVAAASGSDVPVWPWLAGWLLLSALLYRHATFPGRAALQLAAAAGTGVGASLLHARHAAEAAFPSWPLYLGVLVALALAAQSAAFLRRPGATRRFAEHAAATLPALLVVLLVTPQMRQASVGLVFGTILALMILALLAATRLAAGGWYAAVVAVTAFSHWLLVLGPRQTPDAPDAAARILFLSVTAGMLTFWPFIAGRALAAERFAMYGAALAGPLAFWPLKRLFVARCGASFIGVLPIALGALALLAVVAARRTWPVPSQERLRSLVCFAAVAISFVTVAIPLQLEKEWITIGWALEGLGLIALWRRLDHPGLKYFALAALGAAGVRLVLNPALLLYYPRAGTPILNWILYTYLVPAAALLVGASWLRPLEVGRARRSENWIYRHGKPLGAVAASVAAIAVIFVWINLAIADWYTERPVLTLRFGRAPARDLTVSIAWAIYAIVLLLFGMFRNTVGLRWLSLAFLVVTIGKVFLYDLGELKDLYRVASLVGLAVSLILVSLLYQRFVFRRAAGSGEEKAP